MDAKRIMVILGWIMVVMMVVVSLAFLNNYMVDQDDLVTTTGVLRQEIKISKDEYGKHTSLKFFIEGDKSTYGLPGNLLRRSNQEVYNLETGDEVEIIYMKKGERAALFKALNHNSIWGIKKVNGETYLTVDQALEYHKSARSLVYAISFMAFAIGIGIFLTRW